MIKVEEKLFQNRYRVDADLPSSLRALPGVQQVRVAISRPWAN